MSKTPEETAYDLFKDALATTAKAMSAQRDLEVTYSGDGPRATAHVQCTWFPPGRAARAIIGCS